MAGKNGNNYILVTPAKNEAKNLPSLIKAVFNQSIKPILWIIVNDGSTDKTLDWVSSLMEKDERVKLINHEKTEGIGVSFWDGICQCEGDIVTMLPGDNENDPMEILRYIRLLEHVDIVIPFTYNRAVRSWSRNILSLLYRTIINITFKMNF